MGAARKQVPGDLVEQIVKKHSGVVHSVNVASPAARPSLCPRTSMGCSLQCKVRVVVVLRTTILLLNSETGSRAGKREEGAGRFGRRDGGRVAGGPAGGYGD